MADVSRRGLPIGERPVGRGRGARPIRSCGSAPVAAAAELRALGRERSLSRLRAAISSSDRPSRPPAWRRTTARRRARHRARQAAPLRNRRPGRAIPSSPCRRPRLPRSQVRAPDRRRENGRRKSRSAAPPPDNRRAASPNRRELSDAGSGTGRPDVRPAGSGNLSLSRARMTAATARAGSSSRRSASGLDVPSAPATVAGWSSTLGSQSCWCWYQMRCSRMTP
jgi:hypothetical protein